MGHAVRKDLVRKVGIRRIRLVAGAASLAALAAGLAGAAVKEPEVREAMHVLFAEIRVVLPLSLDDETFADPANRERISRALEGLRAQSLALAEHGRSRDAGFEHQSVSLAEHAGSIARSYERGATRAARYLLHRSLEDCVACHSRLPTAHEFPLGKLLLEDANVGALSARERARIQVVARQFEDALASFESLFAQPDAFDAHLISHEDLLSYLKICLTIENDEERALAALARLRERSDVSPRLAQDLETWIATIERLRSDPLQAEPLQRARVLLRAGEAEGLAPASRAALIYEIEAWHELQRFVSGRPTPSADVAEAYYLLGVVEARMLSPFGSSTASPYLEAAVRAAPKGPFGREAYELLEELTTLDYTGSGGTRIPSDVRENLDALERSLEPAPAAP
jgi:hypothetical protein